MPEESAPSEPKENEQHRPAAVLFVYSWDLVLAILALFGACHRGSGEEQAPAGVLVTTVKAARGDFRIGSFMGFSCEHMQTWG